MHNKVLLEQSHHHSFTQCPFSHYESIVDIHYRILRVCTAQSIGVFCLLRKLCQGLALQVNLLLFGRTETYTGLAVQVPAPLFLVQFPVQAPGKQQTMAQCLDPCHPEGRPGWHSQLLAAAWPRPGCRGHLKSEPGGERSFFYTLCFK